METLSLRKQALLYIVASLDEELASLRRDIEALEPSGGVGFPVEIHRVGVGPERAGEAMAGLLANARRRPQGVLMLGVAGAVQLGMETGEMLLAESYALDPAVGDAEPVKPDPDMLQMAGAASVAARMPVNRSSSLTVDHLVTGGPERQELREKFDVASINMEDHAVATAAMKADVPFISVRVVLDIAEQRLPDYLPKLSKGRNTVFSEILAKPWRIPTLVKLKGQMDLCQSVLGRFAMSYLKLEAERIRSAREKAAAEAIY